MTTMTMMAREPYLSAEIDYRLERARAGFGRPVPTDDGDGRTPHRVPRRRALHLPRPRRRPLSLA